MRACLALQGLLYVATLGAAAAVVGALGLAMKDANDSSPQFCPLTIRSSKPADFAKEDNPHICNYTLFSGIASLAFAALMTVFSLLRCIYSWQRSSAAGIAEFVITTLFIFVWLSASLIVTVEFSQMCDAINDCANSLPASLYVRLNVLRGATWAATGITLLHSIVLWMDRRGDAPATREEQEPLTA